MDIQKEKDAFLNVFQFFKSFKGIGFSEETEQFFLKKNKPNDAECLDVSNLNQMWRAWWARAKSQAVPEGFVLVPKEKIESLVDELHVAFKSNLHLTTGELLPLQQDFQLMIEAQEQGHE